MSKNLKVKAFTLLEALVALLVLSGGVLVFQAMTQLLSSELHQQENNQQQEWLLFADQLETELSRSQFDKVEDNKIYIRQDGRDLALGKSKGDDFRKTDKSGRGYQPMIYGLEAADVRQEGKLVYLHFRFEKGLEREFVYRVEEES
ncbi:competence protein ComGF [Streptococcus sanguinis]|uniref:Putative competence protein ComGF n=1 Tax=Streptococcus sanguinis SK115 TaxID=888810 RepID=F0I9V4_STRSA|nr:competence type IV pilus minor pilin ComGF [Streptococcus sanguinis]EGD31588.1 putative competence protein ComGF [Streptococcus sanguinis SK115]MBZ2053072.1 competence protein ComGF [Streptococcus sanguinis]MCY7031291.1 competence protein ComGF [Streptococcus sanguinis]